jgi:DNA-binding response OmpR family regulator
MTTDAQPRVLLVEDEAMVAMFVETILEDMGVRVVGPARGVEDGLRLIEGDRIDAALVDLNLGGVEGLPVADALAARSIPFAFVTGYGAAGLPARFADRPLLQKPFRAREVEGLVAGLLAPGRRSVSADAPPR